MKLKIQFALVTALLLSFNSRVFADDALKFSELRVLLATNTFATAPASLNALTASDNVDRLDSINGIGLEADAKYKWFKVGTKFKYVLMSKTPPNSSLGTNSYLTVDQLSLSAVGRMPIVDKDNFTLDAFVEVGGANTSFDIGTQSNGKGTFKKNAGLFERAGLSVGAGTQAFKLFVGGGYEWNKVDGMDVSGNLTNASTVSSVDLTGSYIEFGLIISGIPSWIKPGGVTVGSQ